MPKGRLLVNAFLEVGLNNGAAFKPISISPDVWYGVTDELTAGLVHSGQGRTGFMGAQSDSICLNGSVGSGITAIDVCGKAYNELAADVRYKLAFGGPAMTIAADAALEFRSLSPSALGAKVGAVGRWSQAQLAVEFQPALFFGLTNRGTGNGDSLSIPVAGIYSLDAKLAVSAQAGIVLPFQDTGNTWSIPLSIGGHYLVTPELRVLAAFTLPRLVAGSGGGIDARTLTIGGAYAF